MVRIRIIGFAALLLLTPGVALAGWSSNKTAEVDTLIRRLLTPRAGKVTPTALSISIGIDDRMVLAKGFGEARAGAPTSAQTIYHIGSLTKQFTAAAVLRLIKSGAHAPLSGKPMTLDTPVRDVFDGVESWTSADEQAITLRSLLTMTSNLPNFTQRPPPEVNPWGAVEAARLFAALKRQSPHGWPNTFEYSNTGYFVLAHIIEAALLANRGERTPAREYVREVLLRPAGLTHTGFIDDGTLGSDLAEPHYHRRPAFAQAHWLDGCGDMASNVVDLFAWNKSLMQGALIGATSRDAMFSDAARVDPVTYYGMGWFIRHDDKWDSFYHSGSVPGFTSYNAILRRRDAGEWLSVTLLTNSDGVEGLDQLADDIFRVARDQSQ